MCKDWWIVSKKWLRLSRPVLWSLLNNSRLDGRGLSVCWNPDCRILALDVYSPAMGDILRSGCCRCVRCSGSQCDHSWRCLPQPGTKHRGEGILRMEDAQDFRRRRLHQQSGFQHTDRPRPSSLELFNKDHNTGRESLRVCPGESVQFFKKLN